MRPDNKPPEPATPFKEIYFSDSLNLVPSFRRGFGPRKGKIIAQGRVAQRIKGIKLSSYGLEWGFLADEISGNFENFSQAVDVPLRTLKRWGLKTLFVRKVLHEECKKTCQRVAQFIDFSVFSLIWHNKRRNCNWIRKTFASCHPRMLS